MTTPLPTLLQGSQSGRTVPSTSSSSPTHHGVAQAGLRPGVRRGYGRLLHFAISFRSSRSEGDTTYTWAWMPGARRHRPRVGSSSRSPSGWNGHGRDLLGLTRRLASVYCRRVSHQNKAAWSWATGGSPGRPGRRHRGPSTTAWPCNVASFLPLTTRLPLDRAVGPRDLRHNLALHGSSTRSGSSWSAPRRRQRLVAHRPARHHRGALSPSRRTTRVRALVSHQNLTGWTGPSRRLCLRHRAPACPVHAHRLRRLGPHDRRPTSRPLGPNGIGGRSTCRSSPASS